MYVIIHKNRVIAGILPWNNRYFMDVLKVRHRIDAQLPKNEPAPDQFPYTVDQDTVIVPAKEVRDGNINPMVEYYQGPTWQIEETSVTGTYEILPLPLESAKDNYKARAASMRYDREVAGTIVTINGIEYQIPTDRGERARYIEKQSSMGTDTAVWKFAEGWTTLTAADFNNIVNAIDAHVQAQFDWEYQQVQAIEACGSLEQLLALEELNASESGDMLHEQLDPQGE